MTTELVRRDGQLVEVDDGGRRRRVVRDAQGRLAGLEGPSRTDELAERIATLTDEVRAEALAREGWQQATDDLMIRTPAVVAVAKRLGVRWPVTVRFMTPEDEAARDAQWGGETCGYRAASNTCVHVIYLRVGRSASETAGTLVHELCHCSQVERLGDLFDPTYLHDDGATLERLAREQAARFAHVELVRSVEPQPASSLSR